MLPHIDKKGMKSQAIQLLLYLILLVSLFSLMGCSIIQTDPSIQENKAKNQAKVRQHSLQQPELGDRHFITGKGWLNDQLFMIIEEVNQQQTVALYDRAGKRQKELFKERTTITQVIPSKDRRNLAIVHSTEKDKATIVIVDQQGNELMKEMIPSFDLHVEWGPPNGESLSLLLTAFDETWNYKGYRLDVKDKQITEQDFPQPFIKWVEDSRIAYLDRPQGDAQRDGEIRIKNMDDQKEKLLIAQANSLYQKNENLIAFKNGKNDSIIVSVYNKNGDKIRETAVSAKKDDRFYDGPYFDLNADGSVMFLVVPSDITGNDSHRLESWDLQTNERKIIKADVENAPIFCSPQGDYCFTGSVLDEALEIKTKKTIHLID